MWPPATSPVVCTLTVSSMESFTLLQGDPATWEKEAPPRPIMSAPRVPFVLIRAIDFHLSLVVTGKTNQYDVYLSWHVRAADTFDMRLARFHLLRQPYHAKDTALLRLQSRRATSPAPSSLPKQRSSHGRQSLFGFSSAHQAAVDSGRDGGASVGGAADRGRAPVQEPVQVVLLLFGCLYCSAFSCPCVNIHPVQLGIWVRAFKWARLIITCINWCHPWPCIKMHIVSQAVEVCRLFWKCSQIVNCQHCLINRL
jgi:hypothetical protein